MRRSGKSIPKSDLDRRLRDEAGLALWLATGSPEGSPPDLQEIDSFRRGRLPVGRHREVLSHLAHDPRAFALLRQLEQAQTELAGLDDRRRPAASLRRSWRAVRASTRMTFSRLGQWSLMPPAGVAGAVVLGGLALVALGIAWSWRDQIEPLSHHDLLEHRLAQVSPPEPWDWPWGPGLAGTSIKGLLPVAPNGGEDAEMARQAFRVGTRLGLVALVGDAPSWGPTIAALPSNLPSCAALDLACHKSVKAAAQVGRLATLMYWQCRASPRLDDGLHATRERLLDILSSSDLANDAGLDERLQAADSEISCDGVIALLDEMLAVWY